MKECNHWKVDLQGRLGAESTDTYRSQYDCEQGWGIVCLNNFHSFSRSWSIIQWVSYASLILVGKEFPMSIWVAEWQDNGQFLMKAL